MKLSSGAKLFHVDRRTDMMKLIVAFCNFMNMPNMGQVIAVLIDTVEAA
jgi:hypothetical protein